MAVAEFRITMAVSFFGKKETLSDAPITPASPKGQGRMSLALPGLSGVATVEGSQIGSAL